MSFKQRIRYLREYLKFKRAGGTVDKLFPIYSDYAEQAGAANGHYFHQDLLVASYIAGAKPERHIDIGSRIDGFVAHVASFRPIEIIDVRDLKETEHGNIRFKRMDLMNSNQVERDLCDSVSCLHAIEHFGLGRYGDPIDPKGHLIGFGNILKMLKSGGTLYISFPIGASDQIHFNAHRVFHPKSILSWPVESKIELISFSYVNDAGNLHKEVSIDLTPHDMNYGCGIYTFRKL